MAGASKILEDNSLLSRVDRLLFKLESGLNLAGGLAIFMIVFLAVANILGRKFLDMPVSGYIDWTEQAMAFIAFFGIAYCQRMGGHIRMDIFISFLPGRVLWFFEFLSSLLMLTITGFLIYGSFFHFNRAWVNGDSSFDIELPTWPSKLVVPALLSILFLRLLLHVWGYIRAFIEGGDNPVAVPLIEDAATQAQQESQALIGEENENNIDNEKAHS